MKAIKKCNVESIVKRVCFSRGTRQTTSTTKNRDTHWYARATIDCAACELSTPDDFCYIYTYILVYVYVFAVQVF